MDTLEQPGESSRALEGLVVAHESSDTAGSPYRNIVLANGIELVISDLSRTYFGDYHLVRLEFFCRMQSSGGGSGSDSAEVGFRRIVERMGVPSAKVDEVREQLLEAFLTSSRNYLNSPEFPAKLASYASRGTHRTVRNYGGDGT